MLTPLLIIGYRLKFIHKIQAELQLVSLNLVSEDCCINMTSCPLCNERSTYNATVAVWVVAVTSLIPWYG